MKLWQRYLFGKLFRSFLFFFLCILIFYTAVDFSIQGGKLLKFANYLQRISKLLGLFLSLSFLLALLRTLLDLSAHREILALQTAGLSSKKLLAPFLFLASLLALASLINFQWISPDTLQKEATTEKVFSLGLSDGRELIYQKYDAKEGELFDVFYLCSFREIWHMKTLSIKESPFEAHFVDLFVRNEAGELEKKESQESRKFPEISFDAKAPLKRFTLYENRSLKTLFTQASRPGADQKRSEAHLHYKVATSLLPLLVILTLSPFALRFSRGRSSLLLIALSLFAFVGFLTFLDSMLILAENQVLPAALAIWGPVTFFSILGLYLFFKKMY